MKCICTLLLLQPTILFGGMLQAQLQPQRVVAFKSGLSFVHESGELPTVEGRMVMNIPVPNLRYGDGNQVAAGFGITAGSERVGSPEADVLRYWTSGIDRVMTKLDTVVTFGQLLRLNSNRGKTISVSLKDGTVFTGKLLFGEDGIVTLESSDGEIVRISSEEARQIKFTETPLRVHTNREKQKQKVFNVELDENVGPSAELDLFYLARGLNWVPVYSVVLQGDNKMGLRLEAQIINNQQGFTEIDLQLGIGQPNFLYAAQPSNFFSAQVIEALRGFNQGLQQNTFSNAFVSQSMRPGGEQNRTATLNDGDVFFYPIPDFSLQRGHTANYRLLELQTTYADIYTVELNQDADKPLKVYHDVSFENTHDKFPLTTGMAFVTDADSRAVGQSKMSFTPIGSTTRLRIAGSPEVVVTQRSVTKRRDDVARKSGNYYRYQTTLTVKMENYKARAVDLRLKRNVRGELVAASAPQELTGTTQTQGENPTVNTYEWSVQVPAGGEKELIITYDYWAR